MMSCKHAIVLCCLLFGVLLAQDRAPEEMAPLAFLLGTWGPAGDGASAASGTATFSRGLQDRVIIRSSFAEFPASERGPASRHDDLMIIYAAGSGLIRADYYDNEGHVIRYAVTPDGPGKATFTGEAVAGEPRFRLTYDLDSSGMLHGEFAMAPPGQSEAFKPYLTWTSRKIGQTAPR